MKKLERHSRGGRGACVCVCLCVCVKELCVEVGVFSLCVKEICVTKLRVKELCVKGCT